MDSTNKIPAFVCDENLGKLTRYLRVGGFDTYFENPISDSELIRVSLDEGRVILTRDRRLIERRLVREYILIESDHWPDQLRQVMNKYNLVFSRERMFTRCLEDNAITFPVSKESAAGKVPPYTFKTHDNYRECPRCGRVFWDGTHTQAMIRRLVRNGFKLPDWVK